MPLLRPVCKVFAKAYLAEVMQSGMDRLLTSEHRVVKKRNIQHFIEAAREKTWPVVRFDNGTTKVIHTVCEINELGDREPYSLISGT